MGKIVFLGNFSQWLGYSFLPRKFLYFSENPVEIGVSLVFTPLTLWLKLSPNLFWVPSWEVELSYTLFAEKEE
jgi:hypothetical protein